MFEELWDVYDTKIKRYIMRKISDKYEAEDILQEIGFRVIKSEGRNSDVKNVEVWLYCVARNTIIDYYRRKDRFTYMGDVDFLSRKDSYMPGPENYNSEVAACLLELTEYLPTTYKDAIIESDYNGVKQKLLGGKWGLSYSGAKNRVQRARKKLKETMLKCCEVKSDKQGNIIELENKHGSDEGFSCINC